MKYFLIGKSFLAHKNCAIQIAASVINVANIAPFNPKIGINFRFNKKFKIAPNTIDIVYSLSLLLGIKN